MSWHFASFLEVLKSFHWLSVYVLLTREKVETSNLPMRIGIWYMIDNSIGYRNEPLEENKNWKLKGKAWTLGIYDNHFYLWVFTLCLNHIEGKVLFNLIYLI